MGNAGYQDGMRIRLLRVERDITVTELARRLGISRPHMTNIERQHKPAQLGLLLKISKEFGVSVDDLIDRDRVHEPEVAAA